MFIKPSSKSAILNAHNSILKVVQNTKVAEIIRDSFFFENIDILGFVFLALTLISCAFCSSETIGIFSLCFSVIVTFKLFFKQNAQVKISLYDKAILVYLAFVILSLFGSTLFALSLKGFIKTAIYMYFYLSALCYFQDNKNKILPTFYLIAALVSIESIIAIIQNHSGVLAIAGWQDTSKLDPTQVISRAYGTLKPFNPNLLAGYLVTGASSIWALCALEFSKKNNKRFFGFLALFLTSLIAIIYTGSRGGYLGIGAFALLFFVFILIYIKHLGGFGAIKKRYKNLMLTLVCAGLTFITTNPAITARIASIFQFRGDSSISFRMNVYASSLKMFLDNPFLGIGVGNKNFREIYGLYMKSGYDALGSYCVFLEIAVESGIFALISFITFLVLWIKDCINLIKTSEIQTKLIVFSLILSICATMTHGLFDTIWFRPQVQILFWLNVAFLGALKN